MLRLLSLLVIVVGSLVFPQQAFCLPPDQVANSPVPPLQRPVQEQTRRGAARRSVGEKTQGQPLPPWPEEASMPVEEGSVETREAKRVEFWNSDRMKAARRAVMQFCQFSAKSSPKEGEQFLHRLSKLPLNEMRDWLERYEAGQQARQRGREVSSGARQQAIDRSLVRIVGQQQPGLTAATLKANHALQARFEAEERARQDASACRECPTSDQLLYWDLTQRRYDPFEVVIDPSTPRGYARRVGAALSLPGDLPRSDPRNFIRGERGQTFLDPADAPPGEPLGR